jgi:hypothetical protein
MFDKQKRVLSSHNILRHFIVRHLTRNNQIKIVKQNFYQNNIQSNSKRKPVNNIQSKLLRSLN